MDVVSFFQTYKDSLPIIPMKAKVRHVLVPIKPSSDEKRSTFSFLDQLKVQIEGGASFEEATPEVDDTVAEEDDEKDVPKANRKPKRK